MTPAIEISENAMLGLEAAYFGDGVASSLRLACAIVRRHKSYQTAHDTYKAHPAMAPILIDRIAKYLKIDPGQHEHPSDTVTLAILLLGEDVYGSGSPEMKMLVAAAENMPSTWWTRKFIEQRRTASQSGP